MTLDRRADLFDDDLDDVAERSDALRASSADEVRTLADRDPRGGLLRAVPGGERSGDEGNRTPNPRLAKAVLCQLSYVPGERGRAAPPVQAVLVRTCGAC